MLVIEKGALSIKKNISIVLFAKQMSHIKAILMMSYTYDTEYNLLSEIYFYHFRFNRQSP